MGRTVKEYEFNGSPEPMFTQIHNYLITRGYTYTEYDGEQLFKRGHGVVTAPQFIKISFFAGLIRVEAWIKFAILPGAYAGEIDLESVIGFAAKGNIKESVAQIEMMIQSAGVTVPYGHANYAYNAAPLFCTGCGSQLTPDAAFCTKCGKAVNQ